MGKHFKLKPLLNIANKPLKVLDEDGQPKDATLSDMLKSFVFNLPPPRLTMKDSIEARRLIESIDKSPDGELEMEEGTHDWLKPAVETYGPAVFGVNAIVIKDAVDDFEKVHQAKSAEKE